MTELKEEYNLDEALKLYDLMMMERDIEYLKSVYAERKDSDWMAAREMVIGKFINQIGFRIDHSTVQQVKNTVESVKSGIKTVQGVADEVKKKRQ